MYKKDNHEIHSSHWSRKIFW